MTKKIETNKNRCFICNIKLGIDGWNCKCNLNILFCNNHRLPFNHNCSIDYKLENANLLKKHNHKIEKRKILDE
jgi:hypothetical protein